MELPAFNPETTMFGGDTYEERRHFWLLYHEGELLQVASRTLKRLMTEGGQRHISRGFIRRHLMLCRARVHIRDTITEQDKPLDAYTATDLSLLLNAYYLTLRGALDNLAWGLTYEWALLSIVDEHNWKCRKFCQLEGQHFQQKLAAQSCKAASAVLSAITWLRELKRFRDPAAHRLPLTIVRQALFEHDIEEYQEIRVKAARAIEAGDIHKYASLIHQSSMVGRFIPILEEPKTSGGDFFVAHNQIAADQEQFIRLSMSLLSCMSDMQS